MSVKYRYLVRFLSVWLSIHGSSIRTIRIFGDPDSDFADTLTDTCTDILRINIRIFCGWIYGLSPDVHTDVLRMHVRMNARMFYRWNTHLCGTTLTNTMYLRIEIRTYIYGSTYGYWYTDRNTDIYIRINIRILVYG